MAHVPEHDLGAAAYAIKAAQAAAPSGREQRARRSERDRQRSRIPVHLRELVIDDQIRRNSICWFVFDD